ncbi:MAG: acyl-CoA desaturase [Chitinophagaceae bacterium]|nr:acyl-CoA desaturase [Chitinophagaceae bacterium]
MPRATFNNKQATFLPALKKDIDAYFKENNIRKTGNWKLFSKTILFLPLAVFLYLMLLFFPMAGWLAIILCAVLGLVLALIGFNVMHDACHGCYSSKPWVNEILGYTLNLIGGNSFIWKQKHNILHHTYTNVDGLDDDVAVSPFLRLCSTQKWVPIHRIQHIYAPFLYSLNTIFWMTYQDFQKYFTQKVYRTKLPNMSSKEHIIFWVSKVFYVLVYMVIPIIVLGWMNWLIGFLVLNAVMGLGTSIIFQLAHVVEETEFSYVGIDDTIVIENEWAVHQVKTTADFSPKSKLVTFLAGGLNYQVEHHLFPRISHIHYPALSKIVKEKCREFNLPYHVSPTFLNAVNSHFRLIKEMGARP